MDFAFLVLAREAAGLAVAEVVVVRADDDVFLRAHGRDMREDIAVGLLHVLDGGGELHADALEREGSLRVRVFLVERGLGFLQVLARRREQLRRHISVDARADDAAVARAGLEGEPRQLAGVRRRGAGDDEQRLRAAIARDEGFVAQAGVAVQFLPPLGFGLLGHVTQDEDDLVRHVEAGVGVVALAELAGDGKTVASEDDFTFDRAVRGEGQRAEVLVQRECGGGGVGGGAERSGVLVRQHAHAGAELEGLEEILHTG